MPSRQPAGRRRYSCFSAACKAVIITRLFGLAEAGPLQTGNLREFRWKSTSCPDSIPRLMTVDDEEPTTDDREPTTRLYCSRHDFPAIFN